MILKTTKLQLTRVKIWMNVVHKLYKWPTMWKFAHWLYHSSKYGYYRKNKEVLETSFKSKDILQE